MKEDKKNKRPVSCEVDIDDLSGGISEDLYECKIIDITKSKKDFSSNNDSESISQPHTSPPEVTRDPVRDQTPHCTPEFDCNPLPIDNNEKISNTSSILPSNLDGSDINIIKDSHIFFLSLDQKQILVNKIILLIKEELNYYSNDFSDFYYFICENDIDSDSIIAQMMSDYFLLDLLSSINAKNSEENINQLKYIVSIIAYALLKFPHYDILVRKLPNILNVSRTIIYKKIKDIIPLLSNFDIDDKIDISYLLPHERTVYFDFNSDREPLSLKKFDPNTRLLICGYIYYYLRQKHISFDIYSNIHDFPQFCIFNNIKLSFKDLSDKISKHLINIMLSKDSFPFISQIPFNILFIIKDFLEDSNYLQAFTSYLADLSIVVLSLIFYNYRFIEFNIPINIKYFLSNMPTKSLNHHKLIEDIINFLDLSFDDFILIRRSKQKVYEGFDGIYIKNFRDKFKILLELNGDINNIKCHKCDLGFLYMSIFQFHHYDQKLKKFMFANIKSLNYEKLLEKIRNEHLVPLCVNCHLEESALYFNYFKDLILKVDLFNYNSDKILELISNAIDSHPETKNRGSYKNEIKRQLIDWINKRYLIEQLQNGMCIGCKKVFIDKLYAFHVHHIIPNDFIVLSRWVDLCKLGSVVDISKTMAGENSCFLCGNCHFFITYYKYIQYASDIVGRTHSSIIENIYNDIISNINNNYKYAILSHDPFDDYNFSRKVSASDKFLLYCYLFLKDREISLFTAKDIISIFHNSETQIYYALNFLLDYEYISVIEFPSSVTSPRFFSFSALGMERANNLIDNLPSGYIDKLKLDFLDKSAS